MKTSTHDDRVNTGVTGLDEVLNGGLPKNRLYLVEGHPGTGKTTLALQFLLEGAVQKERALYITLSETQDELNQVAKSHGWSLDGVDLYEMETVDQDLKKGDAYTFFHPTEVELGEITKAICDKVNAIQPKRVVFDSLSEMRLLAGDSLRYRRQVLELKRFFAGRQCTVLLLDDHTAASEDLQLQSICHGVLMLENQITPHGSMQRLLRVVKLRGVEFMEGYHNLVIKFGGVVIHPRLIAAEARRRLGRAIPIGAQVKSGILELDQLLGGGVEYGTNTLIMGPAGCGKSTISMQYALACASRGDMVSAYLFEEGQESMMKRAAGFGMEMKKYIDSGKIMLNQIDPAVLTPGEFAFRIQRDVEERHVRVMIIDSLNGYLNALPTERYLLLQMHEILTYLNDHGVLTLTVLAQHGLMASNMQGPIDLSYLADTVVLLRYFEAAGAVKKAISVIKKRTGSHEDKIREFALNSQGIRIGDSLSDFRGVLTGVPVFRGQERDMLRSDEAKPNAPK